MEVGGVKRGGPRRGGRTELAERVVGLVGAMRSSVFGHGAALEHWWGRGWPALVLACNGRDRDPERAERVAMGVVEVVFRRCRGGARINCDGAWLAGVVAKERLKVREADHARWGPLHEDLAGRADDPMDEAIAAEELQRRWLAIAALPVKYRVLVSLREDPTLRWTEAEVAAYARTWTGVGPDAVHRILRDGRTIIDAILRGENPRRLWPRRYATEKDRWNRTPPPAVAGQ